MIPGAKQGTLVSRMAAMRLVMHGAMGKLDSCSYCEFGTGPGPLVYKTLGHSLGSSSSSSKIRGACSPLLFRSFYGLLLCTDDPLAKDCVLFYQPLPVMDRLSPHSELLPRANFKPRP